MSVQRPKPLKAKKPGRMPAFQFYPGDWLRDLGVRALSRHDRSVWFDLLCMMHESERRGVLMLNHKAMADESIANALSIGPKRWLRVRERLIELGVASLDPQTGALTSRRMIRDERRLQVTRENGTLGGRPSNSAYDEDDDNDVTASEPEYELAANPPASGAVREPEPDASKKPNRDGNPNETTSSSASTSEERRESARAASPPTPMGLSQGVEVVVLAQQAVLAHPWAVRRQWTLQDIPPPVLTAVLSAISAEAAQRGGSREMAAEVVLAQTRGFSSLPDEDVRYVSKDLVTWFTLREYRTDPGLIGNRNGKQNETRQGGRDGAGGRSAQPVSRGVARAQEAADELRKAGVEVPFGRSEDDPPKIQPMSWRGDDGGAAGLVLEGTRG